MKLITILVILALGCSAAFGQKYVFNPFTGLLDNAGTPIQQGTVAALPATCTVGQVYFATNATAGQNLYYCSATNTWTQQLSSGGASDATLSTSDITTNDVSTSKHGFAPKAPNDVTKFLNGLGAYSVPPGGTVTAANSITDYVVTRTSDTLITGTAPSGGTTFRCGNKSTTMTSNFTLTLNGTGSSAASGRAWVYYSCPNARFQVDTSAEIDQSKLNVTGITKSASTATSFPNDVIPIAALTSGTTAVDQWDASAITDWRSFQSQKVINAGTYLTSTPNSDGSITLAVDATTLTSHWTMDFGGPLATISYGLSAAPVTSWEIVGSHLPTYDAVSSGFPRDGIFWNQTAVTQDEYMRNMRKLPYGFAATTATLDLMGYTSTTSGNAQFQERHACKAPGAAFYVPTWTSWTNSNIVASAGDKTTTSVWTWSIDLSACGANDYFHLEITRNQAVASNIADAVHMLEVTMYQ